ncbi:hypothetical protein RND81_06G192400 [Saponaria officinalis]|uniref:Tetratricopeptide repeat protein 27 homolog n=1 Tax=Saponaria officinalis TaxID=3572 RepID=A0AAW1K861_SAPOF
MEEHQQIIRYYELRLLRCTLPSQPSTSTVLHPPPPYHSPLTDEIISLIETGRYVDALSSAASRTVFQLADSVDSPDPTQFFAELERVVESFLTDASADKVFLVVSVAVAALLAFVQCNFSGPVIELPTVPLPWISSVKARSDWEAWARVQLMSAGSDLSAKFSNLQFIVFAKVLFMKCRDILFRESTKFGLATCTWWLARLVLLQQQILDECCSSLFNLLQVFMAETVNQFGDVEKAKNYWGDLIDKEEATTIVSMVQLEAGFVEHAFNRVDFARNFFKAAAAASEFDFSVSGALGVRTVHQVEPKAQRVLVASRCSLSSGSSFPVSNTSQETNANDRSTQQNPEEAGEVSDVLMIPRIVRGVDEMNVVTDVNQNGHALGVNLKLIQQAVVLAHCLLLEGAHSDELQRWEVAPYVETIDSQKSSCFSIRYCCNVLRIRWESTRSRTKERALLLMDKQVQDLYELSPQVTERVRSCFGVHTPAVPSLRKEYAQLLVSRGLIGEALKIFEDLELWDNLIYCYRLLEKKAVAVELIKARLLECPTDPRLWCSLGDVTNDDACYEKALQVSNDKSARAKRSLARSAYNRGDYEKSKVLWESAMALNTLYPDGWFALGAAALKARDINKAVDGFTRAVQLDPDNGEAWNNLACLHMMRNKSEEAFIAFKEALKFKRNNWQLWKNYGPVAADVGNLFEAVKAIQMVFDLSGNKSYDGELLERMMLEMERRASSQHATITSDVDSTPEAASRSEFSESRETKLLMESLGKILRQIALSVGNGDIWGLYARWQKIRGDLNMCLEALLKQVRSYQGSEVGNDITQFRKFARTSLELRKIYIEISSSTGSHRELRSADMHLRSTIKRGSTFSDTEEYKALQGCLDEVVTRLKSDSLPSS